MRAKEGVRTELQAAHALELQTRDDLIQLLKTRVAELGKQLSPHQMSGQGATVLLGDGKVNEGGSSQPLGTGEEHRASVTLVSEGVNPEPPTRKMTLPALPKFTRNREGCSSWRFTWPVGQNKSMKSYHQNQNPLSRRQWMP